MRKYIGLSYELVKSQLEELGYNVEKIQNTSDDKHRYDTTLVVRVTEKDGVVYLTTSDFALQTL